MRFLSILLTLIIIIIGAAFAALNSTLVSINYFIGTKELPLVLLILIAFIFGILLTLVLIGPSIVKLRLKNRSLAAELKKQHS